MDDYKTIELIFEKAVPDYTIVDISVEGVEDIAGNTIAADIKRKVIYYPDNVIYTVDSKIDFNNPRSYDEGLNNNMKDVSGYMREYDEIEMLTEAND